FQRLCFGRSTRSRKGLAFCQPKPPQSHFAIISSGLATLPSAKANLHSITKPRRHKSLARKQNQSCRSAPDWHTRCPIEQGYLQNLQTAERKLHLLTQHRKSSSSLFQTELAREAKRQFSCSAQADSIGIVAEAHHLSQIGRAHV